MIWHQINNVDWSFFDVAQMNESYLKIEESSPIRQILQPRIIYVKCNNFCDTERVSQSNTWQRVKQMLFYSHSHIFQMWCVGEGSLILLYNATGLQCAQCTQIHNVGFVDNYGTWMTSNVACVEFVQHRPFIYYLFMEAREWWQWLTFFELIVFNCHGQSEYYY